MTFQLSIFVISSLTAETIRLDLSFVILIAWNTAARPTPYDHSCALLPLTALLLQRPELQVAPESEKCVSMFLVQKNHSSHLHVCVH